MVEGLPRRKVKRNRRRWRREYDRRMDVRRARCSRIVVEMVQPAKWQSFEIAFERGDGTLSQNDEQTDHADLKHDGEAIRHKVHCG